MGKGTRRVSYALAQLYEDQDPAVAADAIAPLVSWLSPEAVSGAQTFELREPGTPDDTVIQLDLCWEVDSLVRLDERLAGDLRRCRDVRALAGKDRSNEAALGLGLVAVSCLLGRRVQAIRLFRPPNLLLATEPLALRGVHAGALPDGKRTAMLPRTGHHEQATSIAPPGAVEVYLSLWCREPRVAIWERVSP